MYGNYRKGLKGFDEGNMENCINSQNFYLRVKEKIIQTCEQENTATIQTIEPIRNMDLNNA